MRLVGGYSMKKDIKLISVVLLSMVLGFVFGYVYIKVQEENCDEEIRKAECYVDGGWNCE